MIRIAKGARAGARQAVRTGGFATLTAAMLPAMIAHQTSVAEAAKPGVRDAWVRAWARYLLRLFAIDVALVDPVPAPPATEAPAPAKRGRLVVSNHRSAIDIGVLLSTFGGTMVSRADVSGWPLVGAAARAVGTVFVDRSSARSGAATIRAIFKALEAGATISLFPEGTTFEGDEVRPFHGGAFVAAARAGAEIVPVGLAYPRDSGAAYLNETFGAHLSRMARAGQTRMAVAIDPPILAHRGDRAHELTDRVRDAVEHAVHRARAACGP